jgi:hypothetical protein
MRGTFTTAKFADRAAFTSQRPLEVLVSQNAFVDGGLDWMWAALLGRHRTEAGTIADHLDAGRIVVGNGSAAVTPSDTRLNGSETAQAAMDAGFPRLDGVVEDGARFHRVTFRATFAEDQANFDWLERGVVSAQGVLIDRSVQDQGRKAPGSIWTLEAALDLAG